MAEEKDNWLEDIDEEETSEELDQSDIDALLSSDAPASQENAETSELDGDELDQADIDSLLSGGESTETSETELMDEEISTSDLDQSDIDSLFASSEEDNTVSESDAGDFGNTGDDEVSQSAIDDLLSANSAPAEADSQELSPDQEEIDSLFSEMDDEPEQSEDPFQAEEVDFQDIIADDEDDDSFLSTNNAFADEEFEFDDDIPEIPADEEATTLFETKEDLPPTQEAPSLAQDSDAAQAADSEEKTKFAMPALAIPPVLQERRNQAVAALLLLLLLVTVFIFSGKDKSSQIAETPQVPAEEVPQQAMVPEPLPELPVNHAPTAIDSMVQMETKGPITIVLSAQDSEGDELQYELVSEPHYGTLKGKAPILVYIPGETFSGTDMFHFRANDGHSFSSPALARIAGPVEPETTIKQEPEVAQEAPKEPGLIKPRKLIISAKDFSYNIVGTQTFFIDWENLWDKANYLPYTKQVAVEIISKKTQGKLQKISSNKHQYIAKKFASGKEKIRYRFKLGKTKSKIGSITLNVDPGNPSPEIALQPLADFYKPGEMVLLDASPSMDDDRNSLRFSWEQIAGIPVQMDVLNKEASRISFIAPSSFSSVKNPGPLMRLTAVDKSGKKTVKDIKIQTQSRRNSPLWGKVATGRLY